MLEGDLLHPELRLTRKTFEALALRAASNRRSADQEAEEIISHALEVAPVPISPPAMAPCLVPNCPDRRSVRGLCLRHYNKVRYFLKLGLLHEGWLVRHGRILPRPNALPPAEDSLATLPRMEKELVGPDMRWIFDWPNAAKERKRLEGEQQTKEKSEFRLRAAAADSSVEEGE